MWNKVSTLYKCYKNQIYFIIQRISGMVQNWRSHIFLDSEKKLFSQLGTIKCLQKIFSHTPNFFFVPNQSWLDQPKSIFFSFWKIKLFNWKKNSHQCNTSYLANAKQFCTHRKNARKKNVWNIFSKDDENVHFLKMMEMCISFLNITKVFCDAAWSKNRNANLAVESFCEKNNLIYQTLKFFKNKLFFLAPA